MNATYLVESGQYKKSDLSEKSREFINGMEYALDVADNFLNNAIEDERDDICPTITNLRNEYTTAVIESFKDWLSHEVNEMIVELADEEATEEENEGH
jgi:hypothetical protein